MRPEYRDNEITVNCLELRCAMKTETGVRCNKFIGFLGITGGKGTNIKEVAKSLNLSKAYPICPVCVTHATDARDVGSVNTCQE